MRRRTPGLFPVKMDNGCNGTVNMDVFEVAKHGATITEKEV